MNLREGGREESLFVPPYMRDREISTIYLDCLCSAAGEESAAYRKFAMDITKEMLEGIEGCEGGKICGVSVEVGSHLWFHQ